MNCSKVADHIVGWLDDYAARARAAGFVVGVSGGIDSALVSTLCAATRRRTLVVSLPIHQAASHVSRADEHIAWLCGKYDNVVTAAVDLSAACDAFVGSLPVVDDRTVQLLTEANTRSRLRMTALYYLAGINGLLVAGTGNKVEDYGVGFFTKYGDGGVDLSPIGDLNKSEVGELARHLGVCRSILEARPTDGLFGDDRSDEDQIGASYPELEWAMEQVERGLQADSFEGRRREVMLIYLSRNRANRHKMDPIPVCRIPDRN